MKPLLFIKTNFGLICATILFNVMAYSFWSDYLSSGMVDDSRLGQFWGEFASVHLLFSLLGTLVFNIWLLYKLCRQIVDRPDPD